MARMIPDHRPCDTNSKGERDLYTIFKTELPDDYVVIHSLPWLCSAVNKVDPQAKPTGEIDFLIVHPEKGLLVLEVKSGEYGVRKFCCRRKRINEETISIAIVDKNAVAKRLRT